MADTMQQRDSIPDDIMATAVDLYWKELRDQPSPAILTAAIARLVYAERKRCAKIAGPIDYPGIADASDHEKHAYDLRCVIADAIRTETALEQPKAVEAEANEIGT